MGHLNDVWRVGSGRKDGEVGIPLFKWGLAGSLSVGNKRQGRAVGEGEKEQDRNDV